MRRDFGPEAEDRSGAAAAVDVVVVADDDVAVADAVADAVAAVAAELQTVLEVLVVRERGQARSEGPAPR